MAFDQSLGGAADILWDGENPRSFTGRARTVISGGQFVVVSGADSAVGSNAAGFNPGSIVVNLIADSDHVNGIALGNAGSNELVTVATRGAYIVKSADSISGGIGVYAISGVAAGQQAVCAMPVDISYSGAQIGRAITAGGSEHFLIVDFNF